MKGRCKIKKILSFNKPFIRCYQHYAFPTGIIEANLPNKDYLYNNFINIVYKKGYLTDIEFDMPYFMSMEGLFVSIYAMFPSEFYDTPNLVNYIKKCINNNIYVSGIWNEFFIPAKLGYMKFNFERNYLIYGFNDETNSFLSSGYIGDDIWDDFEVPYDDFVKSLVVKDGYIRFNNYILNTNFNKGLDFSVISERIKNYLDSKPFIEEDFSFGIKGIYDYFFFLGEDGIKLPSLYALYEHKSTMLKRLMLLNELGYIEFYKELEVQLKKVVNAYTTIINLAIKDHVKNNIYIMEKIRERGLAALRIEEDVLRKIF
ncbi:hypothetical protein [Clostridium sp. BNL1100]|uniref:hypothetical protein n=1 Tax=Clostridium sp. BNL1100 TaxID=755731 RepID=UPI00024A7853|nr:hypothetical protein [Clostridium sp. BNL1100]AEY67382.1 hypothetical protein Clo1100_3235 [Clostridium sp. BNL1100]